MMNVMNYQEYEVIQDFFSAVEKADQQAARDCLTGNFTSVVLKRRVSAQEYLEVYSRIKEGIPNVTFKVENLTTDGEIFKANLKITGTHTKTIPSLRKGWHVMKPTQKKVNKIITSIGIILRGNQIMEIRNLENDNGIFFGLLSQLKLLPKNYSAN